MAQTPGTSAPAGARLPAATAEALARSINLAFNNSFTYAPDHPATAKGCADFADKLNQALTRVPLITLLLDRDSLYLEDSRVDTKMNAQRLKTTLAKSGVQSLSFEKGITDRDAIGLVTVLKDAPSLGSVESMQRSLASHGVKHIRLNYVTIRKVTANESVVDTSIIGLAAGAPAAPPAPPPRPQPSPPPPAPPANRAMREIADILSMTNMIRDPASAVQGMVAAATSPQSSDRDAALAQLRDLNRRVADEGLRAQDVSPDEMIEAVYRLRSDLRQSLDAQKNMGRIASDEGAIVSEIDRLSFEVVVRLARQEFRSGTVSVKRLAMTIRRILPDSKELRRLMPMLKQGLLAEGMALADFLELVRELRLELQSDGLAEALEQGATELGLTVDELVKGIRTDPGEAARLIVLAAEIRGGARQDQKALSQLLTEYVERISTHMVTKSADAAAPESAKIMGKMVTDLEQQLLGRLKAHGLADGLLQAMEQNLAQRLSQTITRTKSDWLTSLVSAKPDLSAADLVHLLGSLAEGETDLSAVHDPLRVALTEKGYPPEKIQEIYEKAASRLKVRDSLTPPQLPKGVLNVNNTVFFLKREIGMHLRYHTPFSALVVTVPSIRDGETWRACTPAETAELLTQASASLVPTLRDLDLVGSMGSLSRSIPFVILPMTDEAGALTVKKRIEEIIRGRRFELGGSPREAIFAVSATTFDKTRASDLKSFVEVVKRRHAEEELEARKKVK